MDLKPRRFSINRAEAASTTQSVSPGFVETNIGAAAAVGSGNPERTTEMENAIRCDAALQPSDVADAVMYVLSTPAHVQVTDSD
ncbi:hypothetical protein PPYR_06416 [Photinus pyralis]|uniref:Uncharacterized protein n=1 Tax=Photinus pyralis TaxID=7054 RepID=A0A5N4ATM1_PHOPY|nr:hypothetical protein PPYR_06416 [Photinus pyralis]